MRYLVVGALLLGGVIAAGHAYAAPAAPAAPAWSWTYDSEPQFVSWSSNRGWPNNVMGTAHGSEFYNPYGVTLSGSPSPVWNLEFIARSAWVHASQSVGAFGGSVSTSTDTTMSATATYTGFNGWQPYLSVETNLPTGKSQLTNNQTWAHMDPDLVPLSTFGEGFNIGPTFGITFLVNSEFTLVVNGGYTSRGAYWKEGGFTLPAMVTAAPTLIQPSSVWTGAVTGTWTRDKLTLQGTASYATETINYVDHAVSYRAGPRTMLSGSASYGWNQWWTTSVDGYWVHIDRNDVPAVLAPTVLVPEMLDSNNNVFRINVGHMYNTPLNDGTLTVGPVGSYMYRARNSWDATSLMFVPGKTRYSAGGSVTYAVNDKLNFGARVEHEWIDAYTIALFGIPVVNGQGWAATVSMTLNTP